MKRTEKVTLPKAWIDLEFPDVGRIRRQYYVNDPASVAQAEGTLLYLFDRGQLRRLREIRDGKNMLCAYDLTEGFGLDELVAAADYCPGPEYFAKVYFVLRRDTNQVKIGTTGDVGARVRALAGNSGAPLELLASIKGGRKAEAKLHERFASLRQYGEWFAYEGDLVEYVQGLK